MVQCHAQGRAQAEVVGFVDFDAVKTADPALVRGKIVYVSHQMKARRDGSDYGPSVAVRVGGADMATQKGADIGAPGALGTVIFELRQDGSDYFNVHHTADDTLGKIDAEVPITAP